MSHALFDALWAHINTKSDAVAAEYIGINGADASKYRNGKVKPSGALILQVYDATGWSIEHIRALIADQSPRSTVPGNMQKRPKAAKPVKAQKEPAKAALPVWSEPKRLTVTKTPKWTSTVHRML